MSLVVAQFHFRCFWCFVTSNLTRLALLLIGQNIRQLLIQEIVIEHLYFGKCIIPGLNKKGRLTGYIFHYGVTVY